MMRVVVIGCWCHGRSGRLMAAVRELALIMWMMMMVVVEELLLLLLVCGRRRPTTAMLHYAGIARRRPSVIAAIRTLRMAGR